MNIETGEVKNMDDLTPAEHASGKWIKLPTGYVPKAPTTPGDHWRIERANARRKTRATKRLAVHA